MIKNLFFLLLLLVGVSQSGLSQTQPAGLWTLPYVCQADSFPVRLSGTHPNGGQRLDSVVNAYRNDTLLLKYYFSWFIGPAFPTPFQITLNFPTPQPGNYTIYAKQFLNNGSNYAAFTTHFDVCQSINGFSESNNQRLEIYPNPTNGFLMVKSLPKNGNLTIRDATGKIIISQVINGFENQFDLSQYPAGLYFLIIETTKGLTVNRIIKN